ncbi:hypothetical protein HS088_TW16G00632 [Tripterygium wilfordii]|uniref:Uncharacterized protein n=1 Tax=Tripterygium wilfordii TaxID=458696 RepID=A0A7J7CJF4_TRIWF|nr:hypothetical protein HS088_TW16G00632 [Tripterygium wilfordii]
MGSGLALTTITNGRFSPHHTLIYAVNAFFGPDIGSFSEWLGSTFLPGSTFGSSLPDAIHHPFYYVLILGLPLCGTDEKAMLAVGVCGFFVTLLSRSLIRDLYHRSQNRYSFLCRPSITPIMVSTDHMPLSSGTQLKCTLHQSPLVLLQSLCMWRSFIQPLQWPPMICLSFCSPEPLNKCITEYHFKEKLKNSGGKRYQEPYMDGGDGWRMIRCPGSVPDRTVINPIMLRFRSIASRLNAVDSSYGSSPTDIRNSVFTKSRTKRVH